MHRDGKHPSTFICFCRSQAEQTGVHVTARDGRGETHRSAEWKHRIKMSAKVVEGNLEDLKSTNTNGVLLMEGAPWFSEDKT